MRSIDLKFEFGSNYKVRTGLLNVINLIKVTLFVLLIVMLTITITITIFITTSFLVEHHPF
jgi:hypothetical protein